MNHSKGRILPVAIEDRAALRGVWMPFILSGAVFVPDVEDALLGEQILLLLSLPDRHDRLAASGQVVWLSPRGAATRQGIGIRLRENGASMKSAIENCLAASPEPHERQGQELFL